MDRCMLKQAVIRKLEKEAWVHIPLMIGGGAIGGGAYRAVSNLIKGEDWDKGVWDATKSGAILGGISSIFGPAAGAGYGAIAGGAALSGAGWEGFGDMIGAAMGGDGEEEEAAATEPTQSQATPAPRFQTPTGMQAGMTGWQQNQLKRQKFA